MDISVVVCTYNRKEMLQNALDSLIHQETQGRFTFEIVIIDDGSTDGTGDVVKEIIKNSTAVPIRYVRNEGKGIADARNKGIKEVYSKWVGFFDDDQWAEPQWLGELYEVGMQSEADCVGGARVIDLPDSINLQLRPFCRALLGEDNLGAESRRYYNPEGPNTGNVIIQRELFERIGTFDASVLTAGEDPDFFWRADLVGAVMWYAPRAIVHHIIPESRLTYEYSKHRSLTLGICGCRIRYKHKGCLRWFLGLGRRIFRSFARDIWLLLIALLVRDKSMYIDQKCRLWCALGYARESLFLLAPVVFSQKRFFDSLNFRNRVGEFARENQKGSREI